MATPVSITIGAIASCGSLPPGGGEVSTRASSGSTAEDCTSSASALQARIIGGQSALALLTSKLAQSVAQAASAKQEQATPNEAHRKRHGLEGKQGKCPFLHGTVRCDPYPGYVQGRNAAICPEGCKPAPPGVLDDESFPDRLEREALEFNKLFHTEKKLGDEAMQRRAAEIKTALATGGIYEQTFDEIEHGARVAWRNASKCINRIVHQELTLIDCRDVTTNQGMFDAIRTHLKKALPQQPGDSITPIITVFKPSAPSELHPSTNAPMAAGPRIWNSQLIRFAGYDAGNGDVLGDPSEVEFTRMCKETFGWEPPVPLGRFDVLPLVLQVDPAQPPELFELPEASVARVPIEHPTQGWLEQLGLQWYATPAVSGIELSLGGLSYTAAPFNGWYMTTEVGTRNLGDEHRYNILPVVAAGLGLDTSSHASMWKEQAVALLNEAVYFSFQKHGYSIANHHDLAERFTGYYNDEIKNRGYCPANWKWVVPPAASSTSDIYLGGNKWAEYTLFPQYIASPPWTKHMQRLKTLGALPTAPPQVSRRESLVANMETRWRRISLRSWPKSLRRVSHCETIVEPVTSMAGPVRAASRCGIDVEPLVRDLVHSIGVLYATNGGSTAKRAEEAAQLFNKHLGSKVAVHVQNVAQFSDNWDDLAAFIETSDCVLVLTSTCGSGDLPRPAKSFVDYLTRARTATAGATQNPHDSVFHAGGSFAWLIDALKATPVAVYGRGNSSYARYNRGGDILNEAIRAVGGEELVPYTRGDEMNNEMGTFTSWLKSVANALSERSLIPPELLRSLDKLEHHRVRSNLDENIEWSIMPIDASLARLPAENRTVLHSTGRRHVGVISAVEELLARPNVEDSTCKIVIDVSRELAQCGSLVKYQPGDHIAIFPCNTEMVVASIAMHLGIKNLDQTIDLEAHMKEMEHRRGSTLSDHGSAITQFTNASMHQHLLTEVLANSPPFPVPSTFRNVLSEYLELTATPTQELLLALAGCVTDESAHEKLELLSRDSRLYEKEIRLPQVRIFDLFDMLPGMSLMHGGRVDGLAVLGALVSEGSIIKPRLYSIASSLRQSKNEIAVVVRKLAYRMPGQGPRQGLASSFLCSRTVGQGITFQIRPCLTFQLPSDVMLPILMVAAGSGISPMRSFVEERLALVAQGTKLGKAVLVFGCRSTDNQLLADEMEAALTAGAITHYEVAFSRSPNHPQRYVQGAINEDFGVASEACCRGGHVYVCGNANMAAGLIDTISSIIGDVGFEQLRADGRYHEDVYGYGDSVHRKKKTVNRKGIRLGSMSVPRRQRAAAPVSRSLTDPSSQLDNDDTITGPASVV